MVAWVQALPSVIPEAIKDAPDRSCTAGNRKDKERAKAVCNIRNESVLRKMWQNGVPTMVAGYVAEQARIVNVLCPV